MLNASIDMLYHLGHSHHADAIADSVYKTICEDKIHTPGTFRMFVCVDVLQLLCGQLFSLQIWVETTPAWTLYRISFNAFQKKPSTGNKSKLLFDNRYFSIPFLLFICIL